MPELAPAVKAARDEAEHFLNSDIWVTASDPIEEKIAIANLIYNAREDERRACWEDILQLIDANLKEPALNHVGPHTALMALSESIQETGWEEFGTSDGKPTHNEPDSFVNRKLKEKPNETEHQPR